jgi:hypothetical protein
VLTGVGVFHFVEDRWRDPLGSLDAALSRCGSLEDRLIVLPEAFNLGADYNEGALPAIPARSALERLVEFSRRHRTVFVAGLLHLIDEYSSACLIDATLQDDPWRLLCHKSLNDGVGKYRACSTSPPNCHNPFHCRGVDVASLICSDANKSRVIEDRLHECTGLTLLCVPAWMDANSFNGESVSSSHPTGPCSILANSNPNGCGSFMTNKQGEKIKQIGTKKEASRYNALVVASWAELENGDRRDGAQ